MTRLCANSCFKKLFTALSCSKIQDKYLILNKCINETMDQGDRMKNEEKISSDFYLNIFDPLINLNLSDVFNHFPRLLNVNDVIRDSIWNNEKAEIIGKIPVFNEKSLLNIHRDRFCYCESCSTNGKQDGLVVLKEEV